MKHALAKYDFTLAFYDAADAVKFFSGALEQSLRFLELLGRNHDQHTEAHVESAEHFFLGDVAQFLQMFKDGQNRPTAKLDYGRCASG